MAGSPTEYNNLSDHSRSCRRYLYLGLWDSPPGPKIRARMHNTPCCGEVFNIFRESLALKDASKTSV